MRAVLLLAAFLAATPAAALPPTTSGGGWTGTAPAMPRGGGIVGTIRTEAPPTVDRRDVQIAGEIRQLEERIDDLRDSGQISRREARNMRRDAYAIAHSWWSFGSDGLSDSEADELEDRLFAARSLALPSRPPR